MKRRRVKITGLGPITPAGVGREAFAKGILEPVSRVRPFTQLGGEYGPLVAAYVDNFDVSRFVDRRIVPKGAARHTQFAMAAAVLAVADAGISREELGTGSCAVVTGSSLVDFGGIGDAIETVHKRGPAAAKGRVIFTSGLTNVPDAINRALEISSRAMTLQSSCCSGGDAVGFAAGMVASGEVDIAICGGTESPLHKFPILELRAAGLTPSSTELAGRIARPFDLWRTTGVVSEGATMVVLEPETSPRAGYALITGYGFANDKPDDLCGGMLDAGRLALADARRRPDDIDCLNAWGPGHKLIDAAEAKAMIDLFGDRLGGIPAVSLKGAIGNALGATPAIQVAAAALSLRDGILPPTVNWEYPDPSCPLCLSNRARTIEHSCTLINAHGVGNVNSSLILERC